MNYDFSVLSDIDFEQMVNKLLEDVALFCLGNLQSVECKRFCPCFA